VKLFGCSILLSLVMLGARWLMLNLETWLARPLLAELIRGDFSPFLFGHDVKLTCYKCLWFIWRLGRDMYCCFWIFRENCDEKMDQFLKRCFYHSGQYGSQENFAELDKKLKEHEVMGIWASIAAEWNISISSG